MDEINSKINSLVENQYSVDNGFPSSSYIRSDTNNLINSNEITNYQGLTLLIKGISCSLIIKNEDLEELFSKILKKTDCIVLYRASSVDKAELVKFVKRKLNVVSVAVGDGINDVSMIKEANIGIGLIDNKQNVAAYNADYSIGEFQFIWRLLFVHGQWNGHRMNYFVFLFFCRSLLIYLQQYIYAFYTGFSCVPDIDPTDVILFNFLFTSVPIIFFTIFDQNFKSFDSQKMLTQLPLIYSFRRKNSIFTLKKYLIDSYISFSYVVIIFYFSEYFINGTAFYSQGFGFPNEFRIFVQLASIMLCQLTFLCISTESWNIITLIIYIISGIMFYYPIWFYIYPIYSQTHNYSQFLSNIWIYLAFLLINLPSIFIYYLSVSIKNLFFFQTTEKFKTICNEPDASSFISQSEEAKIAENN